MPNSSLPAPASDCWRRTSRAAASRPGPQASGLHRLSWCASPRRAPATCSSRRPDRPREPAMNMDPAWHVTGGGAVRRRSAGPAGSLRGEDRTSQRETANLRLASDRALPAARAGTEWAGTRALVNNACAANTVMNLNQGALNGFRVTVSCSATSHSEGAVKLSRLLRDLIRPIRQLRLSRIRFTDPDGALHQRALSAAARPILPRSRAPRRAAPGQVPRS